MVSGVAACFLACIICLGRADLNIDLQGDGLHKTFHFGIELADLPLDPGEDSCVGRVALDLGNSYYVDVQELRNIEDAQYAAGHPSLWLHAHSGFLDIEKGEFSYETALRQDPSLTTPVVTFTGLFVDGWFNVSFPLHIRYPAALSVSSAAEVRSVRCVGVFIYAACRGVQAGGLQGFANRRVSGLPPRPQVPGLVAGVASYAPDHPTLAPTFPDVVYPVIIMPNPFPGGFSIPGGLPDLTPRVEAAYTYQEYYNLLTRRPPQTQNPFLRTAAGTNRRSSILLSQCGVVPTVSTRVGSTATLSAAAVIFATVTMIFVSVWV